MRVSSAEWLPGLQCSGHFGCDLRPVCVLSQKHPKLEPLDSTNESFVSLRSSGSADSGQESVKTRLRSAAAASSSSSIRSLASLPSQESLSRLTASSPDGTTGHAALKSLPGYRPATRSSLRHSQAGGASSGESWGAQGVDPAVLEVGGSPDLQGAVALPPGPTMLLLTNSTILHHRIPGGSRLSSFNPWGLQRPDSPAG